MVSACTLFFRHDLILPLVFFFFFFFLFTRKTTIRRGLLFDLVLISSGRPIRFIFLPRFRVLRAVRDPIQRWVVTRLVVLTTTHDTRGMQSTWCAWVCAFKSVLLIFFCRDARMSSFIVDPNTNLSHQNKALHFFSFFFFFCLLLLRPRNTKKGNFDTKSQKEADET